MFLKINLLHHSGHGWGSLCHCGHKSKLGGQACICTLLTYMQVLLDQLKNGGSVEPHKILVEEFSSGNVEVLGACRGA